VYRAEELRLLLDQVNWALPGTSVPCLVECPERSAWEQQVKAKWG
jgi:hypothetical protein